jgi:hypothetical protein
MFRKSIPPRDPCLLGSIKSVSCLLVGVSRSVSRRHSSCSTPFICSLALPFCQFVSILAACHAYLLHMSSPDHSFRQHSSRTLLQPKLSRGDFSSARGTLHCRQIPYFKTNAVYIKDRQVAHSRARTSSWSDRERRQWRSVNGCPFSSIPATIRHGGAEFSWYWKRDIDVCTARPRRALS